MTSAFHLPSSTSQSATSTPARISTSNPSYSDDDDDEDTLPYPIELPRSDFLQPDFDPQTYLSSLRNRHQTLEDLRSDLRQRSQLLNQELLDLVNGNYEEFLSLGADLKGGKKRVEGVRVGLLGFAREVETIKKGVQDRVLEMEGLLREKTEVRRDVGLGRSLLEVEERIGELEEGLGISSLTDGFLDEDAGAPEDLDDEDEAVGPVKRLRRHAEQYLLITHTAEQIGFGHPFLQAQRSRIEQVRKTLLLDLASAVRQAKRERASEDMLTLLDIYARLGAEGESLRVLRSGG